MEAVTASFPPVPAESIVKRPNNEGLFNWSTVMAKQGYSPTFIYGGYGTFDNMNHFFGSNGYRVVDRIDMDKPGFENIWGVSDEDLFRNAVRVFDDQHARGEKIFSVVMSTSNHKPFTFPPGVPGVPEKGGGRDAGIRYADYAIGRFFEMAREHAWFDDTLFVIVADHGARVYGLEDIPVPSYEIPLLVYSPKHVQPGRVQTLTSQIDVAPTVLGMLGFSYDSAFFGIDVLHDARPGRFIPLNHNRDVALFDGEHIVTLGFRKTANAYEYDRASRSQKPAQLDPERLKDAIAFFQEGYELYSEHGYRLPE
jgi:phosphoglycerol transferase MdoB-like AlkP superfamily enzyme